MCSNEGPSMPSINQNKWVFMWRDLEATNCHAVLYQQIGAEYHATMGRFSTAAENQLFTRDQQQSLIQRIMFLNRFMQRLFNRINEPHPWKMQSKKSSLLCHAHDVLRRGPEQCFTNEFLASWFYLIIKHRFKSIYITSNVWNHAHQRMRNRIKDCTTLK